MSALSRFLADERQSGSFPSSVALVGSGEEILATASAGASPETIYDLASLTKVLATAPLAELAGGAGLDWSRPAGSYLPEFKKTALCDILVEHLATHVSGLPAWRPLYASRFDPAARVKALAEVEPEAKPGEKVIYSDLGILVLGEILTLVLGEPLDRAFAREVAAPRGASARFGPLESSEGVAPTEQGNAFERNLCESMGIRFAGFRTELLRGEVHDANAHWLGGVAAHAGLFGTAEDVWRLCRPWLSSGSPFLRDRTAGFPESRGFFWQRKRGAGSAVEEFSEESFGHTGFTGTSVWLDPEKERISVLLTNRVHPRVPAEDFNPVRRRFHETVLDL
jgi:CubicO group peptidase (beta-lactamase class C family)